MPAVIDPTLCNRSFDQCFPARICPESAISQLDSGNVVVNSLLCGSCPGPCVNFCDGYAIRYDRNPDTFEILRRQTLGEVSEQEAMDERLELIERREEESRKVAAHLITDATLDSFVSDVIQADEPVVVDFWAPWCGPCKQMAPVFEQLASEYEGRVKFVKVNTEEEFNLAAQFRISSIPTVYIFFGGRIVDGAVGAQSKSALKSMVERVLEHAKPVITTDDAASRQS